MNKIIKKYLGWRNWAVFQYNSIFENLFVVFSIILFNGKTQPIVVGDIFLFILFSILSTSYGYLINDFADKELDARHHKPNTFSEDSTVKALTIISIIFIISVSTALRFIHQPYFVGLWVLWFLLSTFYSLPPFRLKEHGPIGLLAAVTAQRFIPILMVFSVFAPVQKSYFWIAAVYVFFRGLSSDLNHQLTDYSNDIQTDTQTFAVKTGLRRGLKILRFSLETEKLLLSVVLFYTMYELRTIDYYLQLFLTTLLLLYFIAYFYSMYLIITKKETDANPFKPDQRNIFQFLHHSYPSVILPLGLNSILCVLNPWFISLLAFQIWIRNLFSIKLFRQSFIYNLIKRG